MGNGKRRLAGLSVILGVGAGPVHAGIQPDPRSVNLKPNDMPAGYIFQSEQMTFLKNDLAAVIDRPAGFVVSDDRSFGTSRTAEFGIGSVVILYRTAAEAKTAFQMDKVGDIRLPGATSFILGPIGAGSVAYTSRYKGQSFILTTISFYRSRYRVQVLWTGLPPTIRVTRLYALAKIVDGRILNQD